MARSSSISTSGSYIDAEPLHGVRAIVPLRALSPVMQNRRILDGIVAAVGVTLSPVIEIDTVAALYAHGATPQMLA